MRSLTLTKSGINKIRSFQMELKASDFENSLRPLTPGEWCSIEINENESWLSYVNPLVDEKFVCAHLVCRLEKKSFSDLDVEKIFESKIYKSIQRRRRFQGYDHGRIF